MDCSADRAYSTAFRGLSSAFFCLFTLLSLGALNAAHAQALPPDRPALPVLQLNGPLSGQAAVLALGEDLTAVAAYYRMPADTLAALLQDDPTARIDSSGRVFFVEDGLRPPAQLAGRTASSNAAPVDTARTFTLASLPASVRTIYLDFDGHRISGEEWNNGASIVAAPWDIDGRPGQLSADEHRIIQAVWQRVAEDFAPFDVNVTTREPPEADLIRDSRTDSRFGMRVVVTPNTFYDCDCGGVAYLSVFDHYGSNPGRYQPAWVFNSSEETIAEAISHEVGHTLGLRHDGVDADPYYRGHGTGATSWAPIMGISYGRAVSHWSRGEYAGANNTQDDIATLPDNGAAIRMDDAGDQPSTAARLDGRLMGRSVRVEHSGVIASRNDADWLLFVAGAGPAQLTVQPGPIRPNLDLQVQLVDDRGLVLTSANPSDQLGASLAAELAGGTYYLVIDGVGTGDPSTAYSDYGSLGAYHITGSYPDTEAQAPIADFTVTPETGSTPQWVSTDAQQSADPDGRITQYLWDFGDGRSATGPQAYCTYSQPGTYMISLRVIDNDGLSDVLRRPVSVTTTPSVAALTTPVGAIASGDPLNQCMPADTSEQSDDDDDAGGSSIQNNNNPESGDDRPTSPPGPRTPSNGGSGRLSAPCLVVLLTLLLGRCGQLRAARFRPARRGR